MTTPNKRAGLTWARFVKEKIAIVPHEDADLTMSLGEALEEPIIISPEGYSGFATIVDMNGNKERCKVLIDNTSGEARPVLTSKKHGVRVELDQFKILIKCNTSTAFIPKRLERLNHVPRDFNYEFESFSSESELDTLIELKARLSKLNTLKAGILSALKQDNLSLAEKGNLGYLLDKIKIDIGNYESKAEVLQLEVTNNREYAQRFVDAAIATLDQESLQKINENME